MNNKKLVTKQSIEVDGKIVEYGRIPSELIDGWNGIVFYFKTWDCYDAEEHEKVVKQLITRMADENEEGHGVSWRKTKVEVVIWERMNQTTLVSYRVRDVY